MNDSFFALTTRGLEPIAVEEIAALPAVRIEQSGYRRVNFTAADITPLLTLRTVDDLFYRLAIWDKIGHVRAILDHLQTLSAGLNLAQAQAVIGSIRPLPAHPTFAISASFVGKRNYSTDEIKDRVGAGISQTYPKWHYSNDDGSADLNVRLFIDHQVAHVGLRVSKRPLHERPYKQQHQQGSLKPQVAAALALYSGVKAGNPVVDPFCGSGTILVEAALCGARVIGGDVDPAAVQAAQFNAQAAGIADADLRVWDARRLPLPDASADHVISNLPWGKQITLEDSAELYRTAYQEMRRVLRPGGTLLLLTTLPDLLPVPDQQFEISVFGQNPTVLRYRG
jgi:tRNA (guanine6-N2)-methyltransferase